MTSKPNKQKELIKKCIRIKDNETIEIINLRDNQQATMIKLRLASFITIFSLLFGLTFSQFGPDRKWTRNPEVSSIKLEGVPPGGGCKLFILLYFLDIF